MRKLDEKLRARAVAPELPILRLQRWSRLHPMAFGTLVGLLVLAGMMSPLLGFPANRALFNDLLGSGLFFATSLGIIAGFSRPVFEGAAQDLRELGSVIPWSDDDVQRASDALSRLTHQQVWRALALGFVAGLAHSYVLNLQASSWQFALPQFIATVLLWLAMFVTVPPLIMNALLFSSLGRIARPDLLRPSRHAAFGAAALRPALLLTSLLCAYALLFLGGENPLEGPVLIGVMGGLIPLVGIVAFPLRGIRKRIREQRASTLAALDTRLDAITEGDIAKADADALFQLDAVLDMRERVARAPAWPFDVDALKRILLFTVLPPLTWAAAAIVEIMIDSVL
ncbi:hypothetical protein [Congregibacter litoralis]|uniref:Uncharacterized protein n=1 Tax=Congregibacter litoralis KT71 TaxID=314285 RepID=A4AA61_9GAMM|nr:hypothetical protein [Congregibacter litoralis]EAQ96938.1 hypothetical protein KT71_11785 [Congregibacter litoralis KT71]